jgi:outer membrane protein with beta-barrel domain
MAGSVSCAHAQVVSAAHQGQLPVGVGFGLSNYDLDYGPNRRMDGATAWVNTDVPFTPRLLKGLELEVEGRDINMNRPASLKRMRQDTFLGGPTYTWRYSRTFHPYAKYFLGIGSIDFPRIGQWYQHDTRTVEAPGVGLQCRSFGNFSFRADYEYQFWIKMFGRNDLNPNGFTFGTMYDFRTRNRSRY